MKFNYENFVLRNSGYIRNETQVKIRKTKLLIAGCGIGSGLAVCAARMGFENFILVDGDVVDTHNINRQFYDFSDIGKSKVQALKEAILRINPEASVDALHVYLDEKNTDDIVQKADMVFDTVDFLDLPSILRLHLSAKKFQKELLTALSVGFGALLWYFPANSPISLGELIAPSMKSVSSSSGDTRSYVAVFSAFVGRLMPYLDLDVREQLTHVLLEMEDGRQCPASQLAVGSFSLAAMATTMIHEILSGGKVVKAPQMILHSFKQNLSQVIDLSEDKNTKPC